MSKICQFCKNTFSSKSILNKHQKTAKYCLSLRNIENTNKFMCEVCDKTFSLQDSFKKHIFTCHSHPGIIKLKNLNTKYLNDINILENSLSQCKNENIILSSQLKDREVHIKELEKQIQEIALKAVSRPTTTNKTQINTYIQNMEPVTTEHLIDNAQHLTIEHIKKGVEGYAEYALEYPLKNRMLCSDYARRKVKFKDMDGNVITDPEMTTLAKKFFKSIHEKNKELICKCANELKEMLGDENVMDTVVKLFDYKEAVNRGCDGEKTDFHHDFVRQVCSQTLKE